MWKFALLRLHRSIVNSAVVHRQLSANVHDAPSDLGTAQECGEPPEYTIDYFNEVIKSDEDRKKVHLILLEIASLRDDTGAAPSIIKKRDIKDLLGLSMPQRRKFFQYMFKREMSEKNSQAKKKARRELLAAQPKPEKSEIPLGLYPFIRAPQMHRQLYGRRLAEAALFGQKLVLDCSFQALMSPRELRSCVEQIQHAYAANKRNSQPFDLTICGLEEGSNMDEVINTIFAPFNPGQQLIHKTSKSYLDLFPKEELVYLSPDSPTPLKQWDPDKIFIVGALVDLGAEKPITLAKAKREGIACARLPIIENIRLKAGAQKAFTLNSIVDVLLNMKETKNWRKALSSLPQRFIDPEGVSMSYLRSIERGRKIRQTFYAEKRYSKS